MLLDLYVQRHRCRPVGIHSLCIAASVPQTTALRWIGKLARYGVVERRPCTYDNRVIRVALSDAGLALMVEYLRTRSGPTCSLLA
jgi:DNA-binding MarR family transcriptional regulator